MKNFFKIFCLTIVLSLTGFMFSACNEVSLEEIEIVGLTSESVAVGQIFELSVVFKPENSTDKRVEWWTPSSNIINMQVIAEDYVTVEALAVGEAIIYARAFDGNFTDSITISVVAGTLTLKFQDSINGEVVRDYDGNPQEVRVVGNYDNVTYYYKKTNDTEFTTLAPIEVGTYDIRAEVNSSEYVGSCDGVLKILPQEIQVHAISKEITYGEQDVALTYRVVSTIFEETPIISGSLKREEGSDAGNYRIIEDEPFRLENKTSSNYRVTFVEGNYFIKPAPLTVTVSAPSVYYGSPITNITYEVAGLIGDDTKEELGVQISVPEKVRNAGTHNLDCSHTNKNYNITYKNAKVSILKCPITFTVLEKEKKYMTADPQDYGYQISNPRNTADPNKLFYDDIFAVEYRRMQGENVGDYDVVAFLSGSSVTNYNITIENAKLTIYPRQLELRVSNTTKRYGQADPNFQYTLAENSDEIFNNELSFYYDREEGEDVDDYLVSIKMHANSNYVLTPIDGVLTITPALVNLNVQDCSKKYGDVDPMFAFDYAEGSDQILSNNNLVLNFERSIGEDVGTYGISLVVTQADNNYQISSTSGFLTIFKRQVNFQVSSCSKKYGDSDPVFEYDYAMGSDTLLEDNNVSLRVEREVGENVGDYAINLIAEQIGENYELVCTAGSLTIIPRTLKVYASNYEKKYGEADPTLCYAYAEGSDSILDGDEVSLRVEREVGENVGDYAITVSLVQQGQNYNLDAVAGLLTITKRVVNFEIGTYEKKYGEKDPTFEYVYVIGSDALLNDNNVSLRVEREVGENVGEYAVYLVMEQNGENYELNSSFGSLTITPRIVNLKVNNYEKKYGEADPAFDFALEQGSDTILNDNCLTISTQRETGEDVGEYAINLVIEQQGENYVLSSVAGKLTINKRCLIYNVSDIVVKYNQTIPDFTTFQLNDQSDENITGFVVEDYVIVELPSERDVGTYPLTLTCLEQKNYEIQLIGGNLVINQANIIIKIEEKTFKYGEEMQFTWLYAPESDAVKDDELTIQVWGDSTAVGTHDIGFSIVEKDGKSNYNVTVNGATYTITKRQYVLVIDNATKYEGEQDPVFTFSLSQESDELLAGDLFLLDLEVVRETGEGVGTYKLSLTEQTSDHFDLVIVEAELTILQNPTPPEEDNIIDF